MNTFLEKVMRSPNAASRTAAASRISEARSRARNSSDNSSDMAEDPVRRVIGNEGLQIVRRIDVARKARPPDDGRLDTRVPRMVGMECGTGTGGRKSECQHRRWPQQQRVGAAVLGLGNDDV